MDFINLFNGKEATLIKRESGWWGDTLTWIVDGVEEVCITNTNSSYEFKYAEIGAKGILHWHCMNFWYAKVIKAK